MAGVKDRLVDRDRDDVAGLVGGQRTGSDRAAGHDLGESLGPHADAIVGFLRSDRRSNEAAMKYLLLGAFSSGFLAYGFSLLYAMTGSTRLPKTAAVAPIPFHPGAIKYYTEKGVYKP